MIVLRGVAVGCGAVAVAAVVSAAALHSASPPAAVAAPPVTPISVDPTPAVRVVVPVPVVPTAVPRPVVKRKAPVPRPVATRAAAARPVKAAPARVAPVVRTVVKAETPTQRGMRVLASLHYDWKRLGYRIVFLPGRSGYLGLTEEGPKTITIWVRPKQSDFILAHTIAHELGHALDFSHTDEGKRRAYLTLRGLNPLSDWYGCNGCTDYSSPAGDWAEVFAYYLAGPGDFRSQMAPPPSAAQMRAIALLYRY